MANTPDLTTCLGAGNGSGELLPLSPFYALRYHFGMLLGVDDFETEQAYHRAKMRLHNAWLHGEGVIWGLGVRFDQPAGEVRVTPGLALDAAGHELHLEADACVNLGQWFDKHRDDPGFTISGTASEPVFDAHVVVRFKACLTQQVPALLEPCDNAGTGTAYSRVFETVELLLRPNLAPERVFPYHRLRLMFGLDAPRKKDNSNDPTDTDKAVLDELAAIPSLPGEQQTAATLAAFRRFAALDEIDLKPAVSEDGARTLLFPGPDDAPVVLANLAGLKLKRAGNSWTLVAGTVDNAVRPSHVATSALQELLAAPRLANARTAVGPRVNPATVAINDNEIALQLDQSLHPASVKAAAFSVTVFDNTAGWKTFAVNDPPALSADGKTVTLKISAPPLAKGLTRVIARGTGTAPLLGKDSRLPLAGALTDAPAAQGTDFVLMKERN